MQDDAARVQVPGGRCFGACLSGGRGFGAGGMCRVLITRVTTNRVVPPNGRGPSIQEVFLEGVVGDVGRPRPGLVAVRATCWGAIGDAAKAYCTPLVGVGPRGSGGVH